MTTNQPTAPATRKCVPLPHGLCALYVTREQLAAQNQAEPSPSSAPRSDQVAEAAT